MRIGESDMVGWKGSLWLRGWRAALLLLALCLSVYLPGLTSIPAVDRDECRFAQASRQMLESGDYVVPRVQDRLRLNKPPLIYWLQATSAQLLTGNNPSKDAIWMYRIPSLFAAIIAVLACWRMGISMFGPLTGFMSAAMLAVCPVVLWEAHQARSDMVLLAFTTAALWCLWECWKRATQEPADPSAPNFLDVPTPKPLASSGWVPCLGLWLAVAGGILTKGPITPMVIGLTILTLSIVSRRWRWVWGLRPWLGLLIIAATLTPWLYLVAKQVGWNDYLAIIRGETVGRSLEAKEGHSGPPGYHTLLMVALFFPGCVLTGWSLVQGVRTTIDHARRKVTAANDAELFLICIILPSWLVFEAVSTKLPHYTMPLYPALAILSARACTMGAAELESLFNRSRYIRATLTAWLIAVTAVVLGSFTLLGLSGHKVAFITLVSLGVVIAAAFVALAARSLQNRDMPRLQLTAIVAIALSGAAIMLALPRFQMPWMTRTVMAELDRLAKDDNGVYKPLAAVGFHEDSLVFATRGKVTRLDTPEQLLAWFNSPDHKHDLALVPCDILIEDLPRGKISPYFPRAGIDGFNYSKGKFTYLAIVTHK